MVALLAGAVGLALGVALGSAFGEPLVELDLTAMPPDGATWWDGWSRTGCTGCPPPPGPLPAAV